MIYPLLSASIELLILFSEEENCLMNPGDYIASWPADSEQKFGLVIGPDEQCVLQFGEGAFFTGVR